MAKKLTVVNSSGEKSPFLRGVMVQSLVSVGLTFEEAYATAQAVREAMEANVGSVSTQELRQLVVEELTRRFGNERGLAYAAFQPKLAEITVRTPSREAPFSVGFLSRYLEGCAINREEAIQGARRVQETLRQRGMQSIDSKELKQVIHQAMKEGCSQEAADRFLSRCIFNDSGTPLIVLIGGASGSGKSSVTTELSYLLDIVRTQSTDIMREIIRCYLVPHVAPTLSYSSYNAWRGLPEMEPLVGGVIAAENPVITGFLSQFGTVKVAIEATIQRAVKERHDIIVDGVHVLPTLLNLAEASTKAIVVPVTLAVTTRKRLVSQLARRSREQPDRNSSRTREEVEAIWELQKFMLDQADKSGIPVVANWRIEETVKQVIAEIMTRITERFPPDPAALQ